jgi:O-antigen ligase
MNFKKYHHIKKNNFLILFIIWIFFWLSINSKIFDILNIFTLQFNLIYLINFIRSILPIFSLLFLIFFLINKKIFFIKNIKKELILFYFVLFILFQIIGSLNYKYNILFTSFLFERKNLVELFNILDKYYYLINLISVILFFFIANIKLKENQFKILFFISFIIIFLVYFPLGVIAFKTYVFSTDYSAYWNPITSPENNFLNQSMPRVTGLSRSLMIIYIISTTFLIAKNKSLSILHFRLGILLTIIISTIIWSLQSRFSVYTFLMFSILIILNSNLKKIKKLILILILWLTPILLSFSIAIIKNTYYLSQSSNNNFDDNKTILPLFEKEKILTQNRYLTVSTSGRLDIWKNILILSKDNLIFGYGSQADRWKLIKNQFDQDNASSGLFYALLCGGLAGLITYLLISLEIIKIIFKSIFTSFILKKNNEYIYKTSLYILIFILLRSVVENSFMIFSLDNLIMLISFYLLKKNLNRKTFREE